MNILRDKFPCRNVMFAFGWLSTGETVQNLSPHHFQCFSVSMRNNSSKTLLNQTRSVSSNLGTLYLNYYSIYHATTSSQSIIKIIMIFIIRKLWCPLRQQPKLFLPLLPLLTLFFFKPWPFKCLLICIKVHPTPYKLILYLDLMCSFLGLLPLNSFSQSETNQLDGLRTMFPSVFLCTEWCHASLTMIVECTTVWKIYTIEQKGLLSQGNHPFLTDLDWR